VLSLPWVVERPARQRPSGPRHFAVNCKPTGCRRIWLTTGPVGDHGDRQELTIAVVLPIELSSISESAGWGVATGKLPAGHVVVTFQHSEEPGASERLEAMLLTAYSYALA
jgi:hypothetical protein